MYTKMLGGQEMMESTDLCQKKKGRNGNKQRCLRDSTRHLSRVRSLSGRLSALRGWAIGVGIGVPCGVIE